METGQPLHAFDLDRLAENRIVVRLAKKGEIFTALDQKDRILSSDTLMICDGEKAVAIGGVMGGLNSEIETNTTRVLIESAYFSPLSIRRTSKKLNLATEASYRFERGVDPEGTIKALDRAAQLMIQISDGKLIGGIVDEYPTTIPKKRIVLNTKQTNRLLGTNLNRDKMNNFLRYNRIQRTKRLMRTIWRLFRLTLELISRDRKMPWRRLRVLQVTTTFPPPSL